MNQQTIELKPFTIPKREKKKEIGKFVLCCMDFRYPDAITKFMEQKGWNQDYDIFVVAGACIGVMFPDEFKKNHWRQSFFDHLELGNKLHKFKQLVVIHHLDCGACKLALKRSQHDHIDREQELKYHIQKIQQTRDLVTVLFPFIQSFEAYMIEQVQPKKAQFQFYSTTLKSFKPQQILAFKPTQLLLNTNIKYKGKQYAQQDIDIIIEDLKNQRAQRNEK